MTQSTVPTLTREEAGVIFQQILVAYDTSEAAESALRYAVSYARTFGGFVNVVSVQSPSDYAAETESGLGWKESQQRLNDELQAIAQRLSAQGIRNRVLHRSGAVADVLVQLAAELKADLLLLGAYGHKGMDHARLGSTAEYMLRSMPCTVLTIGPGAVLYQRDVPPLRTLLCASSLPGSAGLAARIVMAMAKSASVEILHVIDKQARAREMRSDAAMAATADALAKRLRKAGVDATWRLSSGPQGQRIVERAKEIHADLILFGLEHVPGYPDAMGTISMAIWQASCPVMTIPGPA